MSNRRISKSSLSSRRSFSAPATSIHRPDLHDNEPQGDLFEDQHNNNISNNSTGRRRQPSSDWLGRKGRIKRTFGAQANADAMLLCGGAALAAHASFDPQYARAQDWIHNHAVGPAVLSPVLTSGLIHTLTEAAFPNSVPISQEMKQVRPLIVGVSVYATIQVTAVTDRLRGGIATTTTSTSSVTTSITEGDDDGPDGGDHNNMNVYTTQKGYQIDLQAVVSRVRDEAVISEGRVSIWLPDLQQDDEPFVGRVM